MSEKIEIRPQPGPQTEFLSTPADIAIFGGAAGGGKTFGLLIEPLRHVYNSKFGAVIFRRTYPQITLEGGMWDESSNLYPYLGAEARRVSLDWTFPSGARIGFAHLQYENDKEKYDGAQIALLCFDQLEQFSHTQFFYMLSRNRSTCGVRPYVRATCNPKPDSWLANFISWWIDQDTGYPIKERSGIVRWMGRRNNEILWGNSPEEIEAMLPGIMSRSVTFIPSSVYDNKILLEKNPEYLANLMALDLIEQERLLKGNWKIRPEAGKVFNRSWFEIVDIVPPGGVVCRFWDLAATKKEMKGDDPDFTAGVKVRKVSNVYYVEDCIDVQEGPAEVDRLMKTISWHDMRTAQASGARYKVRWEMEPGASGKRDSSQIVKSLDGLDAAGVPSQGDKITRAKPLAAQARANNVKLVKGAWNERWLQHMHHQPDWDHDDIMDASSGAYNALHSNDAWGF